MGSADALRTCTFTRPNVIRMLYLPEPKAPARRQSISRLLLPLTQRVQTLQRAQKATEYRMSRGLILLFATMNITRRPGSQPTSTASPLRWMHAAFATLLLCLCVLAVPGQAHAQSASTWNKRGQDAQAREDYDAAFEDFLKAHNKSPKDIRYKTRLESMRFQAAAQHVDRGRVLRQNGDFSGALTEFVRAAQIDPSNQTAQQEIGITQREQPPPSPSGVGAVAAMQMLAQQTQVLHDISTIAGPIQLKPVSNDPITLHAIEDVKNIYQAIGKLAGLNVLFDPEYTSKRIPVDLTNVNLSDALRIVGTISGTFYKPVTSNTIFVAQNTRTKRTDLDDLAVQTFYLSNSSQANDGNEILTGLRLLLDPSVKLYLVPSQNAIVMRGTHRPAAAGAEADQRLRPRPA